MTSRVFAPNRGQGFWSAAAGLVGAAIWAAFATLAGLRHAPFSIIELLFLFAPLVVVPLGWELARALETQAPALPKGVLRALYIFAAFAVCIAFWMPPGRSSAALAIPWLLVCVWVAGSRIIQWRRARRSLLMFLVDIAHVDLALGATWLVVSRGGWRPMGFQEPIILLTAVHFHYSGFATAILAATTLREFERRKLTMPGSRQLVLLIVFLPFVLAAGFVFSPALRFGAAIALSTCVTALAMIWLWFAGDLQNSLSRVYLRMASCAALAAFSLAGLYAVGEYFGNQWITVPGMANSHGVLNGLGFVLLAILAWLIELNTAGTGGEPQIARVRNGREAEVATSSNASPSIDRHRPANSRPPMVPEFVARDFYDR